MMTINIRTFEPGDATRYRYAIQLAHDNGGSLAHLFTFGVGFDAMISFAFPVDNDFIPYGYFAEKFGRFIKNEHTLYVGYLLFCHLTGRVTYHVEDHPSHGRYWHYGVWDEVRDYGIALVP